MQPAVDDEGRMLVDGEGSTRTTSPRARYHDADNHLYETDDCFTRYTSERDMATAVRVDRIIDGRGRLFIGDMPLGHMPVTPSDGILRPATMHGLQAGNAAWFEADLTPVSDEEAVGFMTRDPRLAMMDAQGIDAALMFPSLGLAFQRPLMHDPAAIFSNMRSYNRWLEEEWGFAHRDRIFATPLLALNDVDLAVAELDRLLAAGARVVNMVPGLIHDRSPADPVFDPFWARLDEARVPVAFHVSGDSAYQDRIPDVNGRPTRFAEMTALQWVSFMDRPIMDTISALILHNLFGRFPNLRVLSIENGSGWVDYLLRRMDMAARIGATAGWMGGKLDFAPSEIFRRHVFVCPFLEEDIPALVERIGASQVLLGTDFPHPEGWVPGQAISDALDPLGPDAARRVMRENLAGLLRI